MAKENEVAFPQYDHTYQAPGLTKREYAAIHLLVDDSGDPQLDAMIRKARRMELAGMAMQGFCSAVGCELMDYEKVSELSARQADALLARLEVDDEQSVSETKKGV